MTANGLAAAESPAAAGRDTPLPGARLALVMLLSINLFNYIDRYILAAVEPNIRDELLAGDPAAKTKTGLLSTAFLLTYMCLSPLFGVLGDRFSRWWLISLGVILWSLASGASGVEWPMALGHAYLILLVTRCFVGVGEAAYGPVAPTLISDLYPVKIRGKVLKTTKEHPFYSEKRGWIACAFLVALANGCELAPESDETTADMAAPTDDGFETSLSDPPGDPGSGCGAHGPGC